MFNSWKVRFAAIAIALVTSLGVARAQTSTTSVDAWPLIEQLGFTPIDSPVREFALKDIDTKDKPVPISRFKGQWVWIVFWATWCPACNQQLPGLEALQVQFAAKGFAVIGISTDNGPSEEVKQHVTRKGINFTILHDQDGAVASTYQASAIPTSYLISPDFRLVGLARGVLDVGRPEAQKALEKLLAIKSVSKLDPARAGAVAAQDNQGAALPLAENLRPPSLKIELRPERLVVGEPATLDVIVTWAGDMAAYLIKVPKVTVPDKITLGPFSALSSSRDGKASITYRAALEAAKPGEFEVGPVELSFGARSGAGNMQSTRGNAMRITVEKSRLQRGWPLGAAVLCLGGVVGAGAMLIRQRKQHRKKTAGDELKLSQAYDSLVAEHERIGRIKLQGDMARYSLELVTLLQTLLREQSAGDDPEWKDLNKFLEKIRYGGYELDKQQILRCEQKVRETLDLYFRRKG